MRIREVIRHSADRIRNPPAVYKIGFPKLENILGGGLQSGEILTIGGRPGSGKTSLATVWALWAAADLYPYDNDHIAIFSREVSAEHMVRLNMVPPLLGNATRDGVDPCDRERQADNFGYFCDMSGLSFLPIEIIEGRISPSSIRDYVAKYRPRIIVIDYIQILGSDREDMYEEPRAKVAKSMESISDCVRETGCSAIVLSQFTRHEKPKQPRKAAEEGPADEEKPTLDRFSESGAIENWSQTCIGIWQKSTTKRGLVVMKQRNGPCDVTVECTFHGASKRFYESDQAPDRICDQVASISRF